MIEEIQKSFSKLFDKGYEEGYKKAKKDFERPHGEWIDVPCEHAMYYKCSLCDNLGHWEDNFCSNCGASMKKDGE